MSKIVYAVPFVVGIVFFIISYIMDPKTIVIQSMSVPKTVEEQGYNADVVTSLLTDALEDIASTASTNRGNIISENNAQANNIQALSDWFGFAKPIRAAQIALGSLDFVFDASLLEDGDDLVLRIDGQSKEYWGYELERRVSHDDIRDLIHETSLDLMREIDPYVVAVYHFRNEIPLRDFTETKRAIDHAMIHSPPDQMSWVYALLAHVLHFEGRYTDSIDKNRQAFALDPTFVRPLMRWGENLAVLGRHSEAIAQYNRLLAIEPQYPEALLYWGRSLVALDDIEGAREKFEAAYAMAPRIPRVLRAYSAFETQHGDKWRGAQLLRMAINLSEFPRATDIEQLRQLQRQLDPVIETVIPLKREETPLKMPSNPVSFLE